MTRAEPRHVYVHVPFCRRHCPYCDFAIEVGKSHAGYVDAVIAEWRARGAGFDHVSSLSFGGGTPSSLSPDELGRIVAAIRPALNDDAEVSLEVNPEDIDADVAAGLKRNGFTRVSVGLQSFDDDVLAYLGRAHDGVSGRAAVNALVDVGGFGGAFDVGVDLIVGVPGEGKDRLAADIAAARDLGVVHISTYLLTLEPGTPLVQLIARNKRAPVDDDAQADAYESVQRLCESAGFTQYEVSSHAKPGKTSRSFSQAAHGAQFAEVAVSAVTGEVRVRRMLAVFDCGRILNHKTARNQAIGGMIWGLSYALHEEAVVDRRSGAFVTRDLAEYHVPVSADVQRIEAYFIEEPDRHANPLGAKGLGELGNAGAAAAVINAIYNACGVRVYDFPATLDKLLPHLPPL